MANLIVTRPPLPWTPPTAHLPVTGQLRLPGSRSMTARALILGALAVGPSTLRLPLRAGDTELMAGALRALGTHVSTVDDERWLLRPHTFRGPAQVQVGSADTVMRFVPALAGLADGPVTFDGAVRTCGQPMVPLVTALREVGVRIDAAAGGALPLTVHGTGRVAGGEVIIDASASSQLVSALLLAGSRFTGGVVVRHHGPPVPSGPHLRMTALMLRAAGAAVDDSTPDVWAVGAGRLSGREWEIEPDLSGALPFFAAALVTGGEVTLAGWPRRSVQPVAKLGEVLSQFGGLVSVGPGGLTVRGGGRLPGVDVDLSELGELTPVVAALAALADGPSWLRGVGHIRGHGIDRLAALARELDAAGTRVTETPDGLRIVPRPLRPVTFETYDDDRMAHAGAVLGLAVTGLRLSDVSCTSRSLPQFPALWSTMVTGGGRSQSAHD